MNVVICRFWPRFRSAIFSQLRLKRLKRCNKILETTSALFPKNHNIFLVVFYEALFWQMPCDVLKNFSGSGSGEPLGKPILKK